MARIGKIKKLMSRVELLLLWPRPLDLQKNLVGLHTGVQRDEILCQGHSAIEWQREDSNSHLFVAKAETFPIMLSVSFKE